MHSTRCGTKPALLAAHPVVMAAVALLVGTDTWITVTHRTATRATGACFVPRVWASEPI